LGRGGTPGRGKGREKEKRKERERKGKGRQVRDERGKGPPHTSPYPNFLDPPLKLVVWCKVEVSSLEFSKFSVYG